jgi:hypothetical protein
MARTSTAFVPWIRRLGAKTRAALATPRLFLWRGYRGKLAASPVILAPSSRWPPCPRFGGALAFPPGSVRRQCKIQTRSTRELSPGHATLLSQAKGLGCADLIVPSARVAYCQRVNRSVKKVTVRKEANPKFYQIVQPG